MSRTIITAHDIRLAANAKAQAVPQIAGATEQQSPPPQLPDDYRTKLLKYIPGEVVSLYVFLEAVIKTSGQSPNQAQGPYWFIFVVCLIFTPLYLWKIGKIHKILQLLISTVAFGIWIFALGGPFDNWEWYQGHKIYPALILPIYTFLVALVDP
jgi:hypothetical protein